MVDEHRHIANIRLGTEVGVFATQLSTLGNEKGAGHSMKIPTA
jgi:hypothetical protein